MYRTKGRPTEWHGVTWDERETELGCCAGWLAAVSLTKQWAGHFHLFSLPLSASLRCAIVPWKMSTAADSSFSVDICHGSLGASNRLFDTVFFFIFCCSFGLHVTVASAVPARLASSMLFANIYFDVCQLSLGKLALKCGRPPVPMLSLFNWNWKTWKDPFMQPAMASKPVFHMWFMHDISWL